MSNSSKKRASEEKLNDAMVHLAAHRQRAALSSLEEALHLARPLDDDRWLGIIAVQTADLALSLGKLELAEVCYRQLLPNQEGEAAAITRARLAEICQRQGRDQEARDHLEACVMYSRSAGDPDFLAVLRRRGFEVPD